MRFLSYLNNLPAADKSGGILSTTVRACRLSRVTFLLALLSLAAAMTAVLPEVSFGQLNDTIVCNTDAGTRPGCNYCCVHFTLTVRHPTDSIQIILIPNSVGATDACISEPCWVNQDNTGVTFTHTALGVYTISFSPQVTNGYVLDFWLCAPLTCWNNNWGAFNFIAYGGGNWVGSYSDAANLYTCGTGSCSGCDNLSVYDDDCFTNICINHKGTAISSFTLSFSPPLQDCNGFGGLQQCAHDVITAPDHWTYTTSPSMPPINSIVFSTSNSAYDIQSCQTVCIQIPNCELINQENHTVTLTDGNECSSNTFTIPMGIKKADVRPTESITETGGNFPNPLDASTGFKTTIPFITDAGGMATIRIMNEAGETVLTDHEQLLGAGHHFFYITAEKLPAGTYYYTIEFPKGITIVSKSMLVVK